MGTKLTKSQLIAMERMMEAAEAMADQLLHIMDNSNLSAIEGSQICIRVVPEFKFARNLIEFGFPGKASGHIKLAKGVYDERYEPTGNSNSAEYELIFANETVKERMREILRWKKPLPPDGLWISVYDDPINVDCGVQISEQLAE